jgi:LysM repeat protein
MKTSNPFVPTITLIDLPQRNRREQFKIGLYTVLIAQLLLVLGMLMFNGTRTAAFGSGAYEALPLKAETTTPAVTQSESRVGDTTAASSPAPTSASLIQPVSQITSLASSAGQSAEISYVVKSGDTLSRIARVHGTTVKAIKSANSLDTERLVVGRKLKIPETKG